MEDKKYEIVEDMKSMYDGKVLYRIRALKDFDDVKKGDLGGYIQDYHNLSQEGNCWIYNEALVCGNAKVYFNANVYQQARICDSSKVFGNAQVYGCAIIYNDVEVFGEAKVYGNAKIYDKVMIFGKANVYGDVNIYDTAVICGSVKIYGDTRIYDRARVCGYVEIYDSAKICDKVEIYGHAKVYGDVEIRHYARVHGDAEVYGNAKVCSHAEVFGDAKIKNKTITGKVNCDFDNIIEIQNPEGRLVTAILKDGEIYYTLGCQNNITEEKFRYRIENTEGGLERNPHRKFYYTIIDMVKLCFANNK